MRVIYQKTILDNKLRVISEKIDSVSSITLGVWIDVGSRDEEQNENGISHFIEHMLFKGTKKRSTKEIALALESLGGTLNAFTGRENTCLYAKVLDEHLEIALDVLSDLLLNPLFNPYDFKKEKKIIAEEIKELEDMPSEVAFDLLMEAMWGEHPLGRPVIGDIKNIQKLERGQLLNFMREKYVSPKIVIAACGNLIHQRLVKLVENKFKLNNPIPKRIREIPPLKLLSQKIAQRRKTAQTHICIGFPGYSFKHPKRYAALLLGNILGGGMSSRLFQNLREKFGMVYTIHTFIDSFKDKGIFGVYLGTDKKQVLPAVEQVLKELHRIKKDGLKRKELEDAKYQLKGNLILGAESTSTRMNRLARLEIYLKDYISLEKTISLINQVKKEEVIEVANELMHKDRLSVAMLGQVGQSILQKINWDYV
ncbi:MAG: insulinase family protein [candidate division Zixibacteria bacterium]|nr:insulinase family protein [candidate division Zixibacteria bacterium]